MPRKKGAAHHCKLVPEHGDLDPRLSPFDYDWKCSACDITFPLKKLEEHLTDPRHLGQGGIPIKSEHDDLAKFRRAVALAKERKERIERARRRAVEREDRVDRSIPSQASHALPSTLQVAGTKVAEIKDTKEPPRSFLTMDLPTRFAATLALDRDFPIKKDDTDVAIKQEDTHIAIKKRTPMFLSRRRRLSCDTKA